MKTTFLVIALFILSAIAIHAQTDIHGVDFKNFTYTPSCTDPEPEKITVKKGEFSREKQMDGYIDRFDFRIMAVTYGDLSGDKNDEAIVLSTCNTGGTGNFTEGFIFRMKAGKPSLWLRIPGGDRADGGLRSATVDGGLLVVEINDPLGNGGSCCPEFSLTTKYRVAGIKLIPMGAAVRRELYPKQRISFAKGASGTTFKVTIDAQDLKRFTIGARARQMLTVSASRSGATIRLLDDAQVTEGANSFTARLPKNGDYTFEVANYNDKAIDVTLTVKIQ